MVERWASVVTAEILNPPDRRIIMAEIEHVHTFIETSRESEVLTSFAANYPVLGRFLGVIVHSTCDCGAVTDAWHSEAIVEATASTEEE